MHGLGDCQGRFFFPELPDDNRLQILAAGGEDRGREFRTDNEIGLLQDLDRSDHAQIDFTHARAIADLETGEGEQLRADRLFDVGLPHPDNPITAAGKGLLLPNDPLKDGHDRLEKHRLQFARRSREEKQMGRRTCRVQAGGDVETGRASIFVGQNLGATRHLGLAQDSVGQPDPTPEQTLRDRGLQFRIGHQFQTEQLGCDLSSDVVGRRPETAGDEDQVRPVEVLAEGIADGGTIGDRDLPLDAQAQRKNLARDEGEVRVEHVSEEDFGAGVDDDDSHWEEEENVQRPTLNVQR